MSKVFEFLSLLTVEPYLFAIIFINAFKKGPTDQLILDKLCLSSLHAMNFSTKYCLDLPEMTSQEDFIHVKAKMIKGVNDLTLYALVVATILSIVSALLIGPWIDKCVSAKKVLLIGGSLAGICESVILLLNVYFYDKSKYYVYLAFVPYVFTGGMLAVLTGVWSYIASTTPPNMRAMRLTVAEFASAIAVPLATYCSESVLKTKPILKDGQLHNYTAVFIICAGAYLLSLLWTIFMLNEKKDSKEFNRRFSPISETTINSKEVNVSENQSNDNKHINPMKLLFNLNNIKDMFRTYCKKRTNYGRLQIWLLFLAMACYLLARNGPTIFFDEFAQKNYEWDSRTAVNSNALTRAICALAIIIILPILLKYLRLRDTTIVLRGLDSYFGAYLIRAFVLTAKGFWSTIPLLGFVAPIGIRSRLSKLVEAQELGRVFCWLSVIESSVHIITGPLFTYIYQATSHIKPGLPFIIAVVVMFIPFPAIVWMQKKCDLIECNKEKVESNGDVCDGVTQM